MACSLQKLFAVEEEFEDEDFLSAVEDAENRFTGSLPVNAGRLRPVSSRPQETVQAQSSRLLLLHPTAPSEALGLPDLDLCLPASSTPSADSRPSCIGAAPLRPVSTSSSWIGNQRRVTVTEVLRETARPQSSALHPLLTFESQQQQVGGFEGPEQDEFDKVLASMELEEPGMELECGVSSEAIPILPAQQREGSVLAKKARVVDLSGSCQKGPVPAIHKAGIMSAQDESLDPVIQCRTPRPPLRPGAVGHLPVPTALTVPTQQLHWEVCPQRSPVQALQPLQAARGTIQSSPQNRFPCQPFQSPSSWLSGKAHLPRPRTPNSSCSTPSRTSSGLFPRIPLQPQAPVSSIGSPVGTPKGPQGALQTPIVTNHLVQLVTAASRTPQQPTHPSTRAKTRRFPGPAGILPHQSGRSLEDIMVSAPQTPTHGALAKFQTEQAALKQLPRNKVPNMAVMIKSLTRSTMDASVVFKDPTGEMQGTVHRLLLETCQNELKPGSVLLLKQIGVFSPSLRNHYLNVTPNNLVHIYSPDSGDGSFLKPSQPFPKDSGSFQHDVAAKPEEGFRTAQNLEAEASPEEELPEADDLDGLLSELPEDFFCGTSS
ncbi:homologous recombination OB-fold protein isoform X6 [Homo sapiens]|uniref:homologous recombination OB-fold protein isoform X6 n=1 Tax=Homo sapiens TaxID=9606 RepID=UPI001FB06645|nr:homologous recombination OB-fold protein isoform X6 [Homo sapiens]XP_054173071.1 homologous recombination OB-fold protein isoform X6 [Homo sapiens]